MAIAMASEATRIAIINSSKVKPARHLECGSLLRLRPGAARCVESRKPGCEADAVPAGKPAPAESGDKSPHSKPSMLLLGPSCMVHR
jgi:hypothetical protein